MGVMGVMRQMGGVRTLRIVGEMRVMEVVGEMRVLGNMGMMEQVGLFLDLMFILCDFCLFVNNCGNRHVVFATDFTKMG